MLAWLFVACSSSSSSSPRDVTEEHDPALPAIEAHSARIARGTLQDGGKEYPTLDILFSTSADICSDVPSGAEDTTVGLTFTGTGVDLVPGTYQLTWPPRAGEFAGWMHHVGDDCKLEGPGVAVREGSTAEILRIGPDEVTAKVHLVSFYGTMDGTYTARSCAFAEPLDRLEGCKPR